MTEGSKLGKVLTARCVEATKQGTATIEDFYREYGCICPPVLVELYHEFYGGFVERFPHESTLFYSPQILVDCVKDLVPIDIATTGLMPIADFKDNQFLCYRPMKKVFVLYSAIDEVVVLEDLSIKDLINKLGFQ